MQFKQSISMAGLLFAGIGSVIGSGWLFGPLYAAQVAGPAAVISWILGGLLMIVISLTFAELCSAFPVAGGMIQYAQYSHGTLVSFITGWMIWISSVTVAPVETLGMIQYAANYIPGLVNKKEGITILTYKGIAIAAVVMFVMCKLNYYGARFFSRSNSVITVIKLVVPIVTIGLLFTMNFHWANFHLAEAGGFAPFGWHGILAALPLGGVIYSFIGSNTILQLAAETKNPQRNIPLALIGSMVFCILLYAGLQMVFVGALDAHGLVHGWKALSYTGDSGPFAGIISEMGFAWFVVIIYADALLSPFGTGFVYTASTARINYGLSKVGFFSKYFEKITPHGVPMRGIVLNYIVGLLLFLPFPAWQSMASFIISCFIVSYIVGPLTLLGLRKSEPNKPRPFRLPCVNFFGLLAFYICNLLIFWTGWQTVSKMMIAIILGCVFFVWHCVRKADNTWYAQWKSAWWIVPYFAILSFISYWGSFGKGLNKIHFGPDFLVIAVLSAGIFYLAIRCSKRHATA